MRAFLGALFKKGGRCQTSDVFSAALPPISVCQEIHDILFYEGPSDEDKEFGTKLSELFRVAFLGQDLRDKLLKRAGGSVGEKDLVIIHRLKNKFLRTVLSDFVAGCLNGSITFTLLTTEERKLAAIRLVKALVEFTKCDHFHGPGCALNPHLDVCSNCTERLANAAYAESLLISTAVRAMTGIVEAQYEKRWNTSTKYCSMHCFLSAECNCYVR